MEHFQFFFLSQKVLNLDLQTLAIIIEYSLTKALKCHLNCNNNLENTSNFLNLQGYSPNNTHKLNSIENEWDIQ